MSPTTIEERECMTRVPYASAVGNLMYTMVCIRPDLSQAVMMLSTCTISVGVIGR